MTKPEYEDYVRRYLTYRFRGDIGDQMHNAPYNHRRLLNRFKEVLFPTDNSAVDFENDATVLALDKWIRTTLGPSNQCLAMQALKWFARWLHTNRVIRVDWCADLPAVKWSAPKRVKSVITEEQFRRLQKDSIGCWYYWPIVLSWYTGLACVDACTLRWREVDMEACMIRRNRKKTGSICTIPFVRDGELHKMMEYRLRMRRLTPRLKLDGEDDDPKNDFVDHESASHMRMSSARVCPPALLDCFKVLKKRAGITDPRITIHSLRVSFVSRLANSNVNMAVAMAMTGHKSVQTFQRYVRPTEESLRKGLEEAFSTPAK